MRNKDEIWKNIIDKFFEEFIEFFLPDLYKDIDFNKKIIPLEQELNKLLPKSKESKRRIDKLFQVSLKNGQENLILIHIEIQGYYDLDFSERLFSYYYRIYDRFKRNIETLAIFTDNNKNYKPNLFEKKFYGTEIIFKYDVYKILEQKEEELLKSNNIFALVVLATLYSIKSNNNKDLHFEFKLRLAELLFKRNYSEKYYYELLTFIDVLLDTDVLKSELFYLEVNKMATKQKKKEIICNLEKIIIKKGIEKGLKQGIEEGKKQGKIQGKIESKKEIIVNMYKKGFDINIISEITNLSEEEINKIIK